MMIGRWNINAGRCAWYRGETRFGLVIMALRGGGYYVTLDFIRGVYVAWYRVLEGKP